MTIETLILRERAGCLTREQSNSLQAMRKDLSDNNLPEPIVAAPETCVHCEEVPVAIHELCWNCMDELHGNPFDI